MKSLAHAAAKVISSVQLRSLRLREGSFGTSTDRESDWAPAKAALGHEARVEKRDVGLFLVFVTYNFEALPYQEDREEAAEPNVYVRAEYEISYGFQEALDASSEELDAFAKTNAIFNSWSYFREYLDSCLSRMSLPPFYLPVFRLSSHVEAGERTEDAGAAKKHGEVNGVPGEPE